MTPRSISKSRRCGPVVASAAPRSARASRAERHGAAAAEDPPRDARAGARRRLPLALPADDQHAAVAAAAEPQVTLQRTALRSLEARHRQRDLGLLAVGEPDDVGERAVLGEPADDLDPVGEARGEPALVLAAPAAAGSSRRLGDHPEDPLGAEHELAQRGPAAVCGVCSV